MLQGGRLSLESVLTLMSQSCTGGAILQGAGQWLSVGRSPLAVSSGPKAALQHETEALTFCGYQMSHSSQESGCDPWCPAQFLT